MSISYGSHKVFKIFFPNSKLCVYSKIPQGEAILILSQFNVKN